MWMHSWFCWYLHTQIRLETGWKRLCRDERVCLPQLQWHPETCTSMQIKARIHTNFRRATGRGTGQRKLITSHSGAPGNCTPSTMRIKVYIMVISSGNEAHCVPFHLCYRTFDCKMESSGTQHCFVAVVPKLFSIYTPYWILFQPITSRTAQSISGGRKKTSLFIEVQYRAVPSMSHSVNNPVKEENVHLKCFESITKHYCKPSSCINTATAS